MKATSNGITINYEVEGAGPWVVLSHSLACSLAMWDEQVQALRSRFRVLRFDTRGHGRSPVPAGPYSVADLADDALALLDRLGISQVSFCGLSLGGAIGMRIALDAPERLDLLVLAATAAQFDAATYRARAATVRVDGLRDVVDGVMERWFTPAFPDVRRYREMFLATDPEGYARCSEAVAAWNVRGELGAVRA